LAIFQGRSPGVGLLKSVIGEREDGVTLRGEREASIAHLKRKKEAFP